MDLLGFFQKNWKTIAVTAVSTVVFCAVFGVLTAATFGVGAPVALFVAGAASGAVGYALGQSLDGRRIDPAQLAEQSLLCGALGLATFGLGRFVAPLVRPVMDSVAPELAAVPEAVQRATVNAGAGAAFGTGIQTIENVVTGRPLAENLPVAAGAGALGGLVGGELQGPISDLVDARIAPESPAEPSPTPGVVNALDGLGGTAARPPRATPLETKLATGVVSDETTPINAGVNKTLLGSVDGQKVVIKPQSGLDTQVLRQNIPPGHDMERELAAYQVAKYMGIDMPVTVVRDTPFGRAMVQEFRPGVSGNQYGGVNGLANADQVALFDAVIGNEDRHGGNMLVDGGKIVPIDHGLAFPSDSTPTWGNENLLQGRVSSSPDLTPTEKALLARMSKDAALRRQLGLVLDDPGALDLMYARIDRMLATGKVATVSVLQGSP